MKPVVSNNAYLKKYVVQNQRTLKYILNPRLYNVAEGAIRATKTQDNRQMFCINIDKSPDEVFLAVAPTQSSAKTILFEGEGLGIKHWPEWQARTEIIEGKKVKFRQRIFEGKFEGNDALILLPKHGSGHPVKYIVAVGGNKSNSYETFKGWGIGMFIATQWELLHEETRYELLKRTSNSRYRMHFVDINPVDPRAEIYKQIERWQKSGKLNYIHKTLYDNPVMTEERIQEIISEYDKDSIIFKRDILGERVAAEGLIYRVGEQNIIPANQFDPNIYHSYMIIADPGENSSATAFVVVGITKGFRNIDVIAEYEHRNKGLKAHGIKMPSDYVIDYFEFIKGAVHKMGRAPRAVYSDHDTTFIREYERLHRKYSVNFRVERAIKEEIDVRIKTGVNYLAKGRLRFYDNCTQTIGAFKSAIYDPELSQKGKYVRYDKPEKGTRIDLIDAVEYGVSAYRYELSLYKGV